jgi:hypothetical protein
VVESRGHGRHDELSASILNDPTSQARHSCPEGNFPEPQKILGGFTVGCAYPLVCNTSVIEFSMPPVLKAGRMAENSEGAQRRKKVWATLVVFVKTRREPSCSRADSITRSCVPGHSFSEIFSCVRT